MTDLIHFVLLIVALAMLGVGLWMIAPAAMFVGLGGIVLVGIAGARMSRSKKMEQR